MREQTISSPSRRLRLERARPRRTRLLAACALALLLLAAITPCAAGAPVSGSADPGPALVILVRHAEKAAEPADDPPLSPLGELRAQALAAALRDAGVSAIFTTQMRRNRDTAAPLAERLGIAPEVIAIESGQGAIHPAEVSAAVRRKVGEVVLVVGHSNTVPAIIAALGGPRMPELSESDYDDLFLLVPGPGGAARLVRSSYEPASAAPSSRAEP